MWKEALRLQHQRCEVYAQWDAVFKQVLDGSLSAEDFSSLLTQTIVVKFQEISAAVRAIRDELSADTDLQPSMGTGLRVCAAVRKWAADLQLHEKAKYDATVELQGLILEHLSHRSIDAHNQDIAAGTVNDENDKEKLLRHHCRDCPLAALLLRPSPERSTRCFRILFNIESMDEHTEEDSVRLCSGSLGDDDTTAGGGALPGVLSAGEANRDACVRRCQQFNARHALLRRTLHGLEASIAALMLEAQEEISDEAA